MNITLSNNQYLVTMRAGETVAIAFTYTNNLTGCALEGTIAFGTAFRYATLGVGGAGVAAGGSGYVVGDALTISGGTFTTAAQLLVTAIGAGGAVTAVGRFQPGLYSVLPTSPANTTGGTGTGCTLNLVATPGGISAPSWNGTVSSFTLTVAYPITQLWPTDRPYTFDLWQIDTGGRRIFLCSGSLSVQTAPTAPT